MDNGHPIFENTVICVLCLEICGNMWKHVGKILLEIFGNMWNHVEACW